MFHTDCHWPPPPPQGVVILSAPAKKKHFPRHKTNRDNEKKKKLPVYSNHTINLTINIHYHPIGVFLRYFLYFESIFRDSYVTGVAAS